MRATDKQVGGSHYKNWEIQPIEFINRNKLPFIEGCVVKYVCRWREKGGIEDLKKIKHYVDLLIELEGLEEEGDKGYHNSFLTDVNLFYFPATE